MFRLLALKIRTPAVRERTKISKVLDKSATDELLSEREDTLVPSSNPDTPATEEEIFGDAETAPAYFDTRFDPSAGIPASDDGAPIAADALLFWRFRTGKRSLVNRRRVA